MSVNEIVNGYLKWEEREKWLLLRDLAYGQLENRFFSSAEKIGKCSCVDFRKYYLGFCTISLKDYKYKLSVGNISNFLDRYSVSELKGLIEDGKIQMIGNASWSQLHMGFRNDKWPDVKKAIGYLLFDERGKSVSEMSEDEVIERLSRVLGGDMAVAGFSRAKITPLLLICDNRDRFGVWNSVSDKALHRLGLKPKSDITRSRLTSDYLIANKAFKELRETYGFRNLVDVDMFVWYFLENSKIPLLKEKRTVQEELLPIRTKAKTIAKPLDPYLAVIKEKMEEAEHYLQEERILPETIVKLSFESVMYTLMRRIIDLKGIRLVEDLRRQKKLYFQTLVDILKRKGEPIDSFVELELLRDLRNRVEHEAFKATKQNAIWACDIAKSFISQKYPQIFVEQS